MLVHVWKNNTAAKEIELQLLVDYKTNGNIKAMQQLVLIHTPFVKKIAKSYYHDSWYQEDDIIHEGILGLINAINKFDLKSGYKLISYAVWHIRSYMQEYLKRMYRPTERFDESYVAPLLPTQINDIESYQLSHRLDEAVQKVLLTSCDDDKFIFTERYTKHKQSSMKKIGEELGISKQAVDQREKKLLNRIREEV